MWSWARSPGPTHVAAAMFTPASLIAAATRASAPGVFSMSMTRSTAIRPVRGQPTWARSPSQLCRARWAPDRRYLIAFGAILWTMPRVICAVFVLAMLALTACGGGDSGSTSTSGATTTPGNADPTDVEVIDGWVTSLRHGDVDAAAGYFALPSVAE